MRVDSSAVQLSDSVCELNSIFVQQGVSKCTLHCNINRTNVKWERDQDMADAYHKCSMSANMYSQERLRMRIDHLSCIVDVNFVAD